MMDHLEYFKNRQTNELSIGNIHDKMNQPEYDYYYNKRLSYKDDPRLLQYIEFSKCLDGSVWGIGDDTPCYNPETMLFKVRISTPISFQGKADFNGFDLEFFPYMELGSSWNFSGLNFLNCIFRLCVDEGKKQKGNSIGNFISNL